MDIRDIQTVQTGSDWCPDRVRLVCGGGLSVAVLSSGASAWFQTFHNFQLLHASTAGGAGQAADDLGDEDGYGDIGAALRYGPTVEPTGQG